MGTGGKFLIHIFDIKSRKLIKSLEAHTNPVVSLTLLRKQEMLISGSWDRTVRVWTLTPKML